MAFLDADMDLHPEQLADFFAIMESRRADAVIGSKFHPESKVDYPLAPPRLQLLLLHARSHALRIAGARHADGHQALQARGLDRVLPRILVKRFAFDLELLANVHHFGYRIAEAPVT